jgi:hypothetical protein
MDELHGLIEGSGALEMSDPGYRSSHQLDGLAVDAVDREGKRMLILAFRGGQLSNDHYPYYEMLFRAPQDPARLEFVRSQRYFYDAAGMEGFEWYVIWPVLAVPAMIIGMVIFCAMGVARSPQPDHLSKMADLH